MVRWVVRYALLVAVTLAMALTACSDTDDGSTAGSSVDADSSAGSETADGSNGVFEAEEGDDPDQLEDASTTSSTADTNGSASSASGSTTPSTASSGPSVVRVGPVMVERTEPCQPLTVAPTFTLVMDSDGGPETIGPGLASQMEVAEGSPTIVAEDTTFTVAGAWNLNVQMLEHLSGTTRGTVHSASSRLEEEITIDGVPVTVSWSVVENGDEVTFGDARFEISPSCVQILTGTMLTFTDTAGTQTIGSINPSASQPVDLPLDQAVTILDGATFDAPSTSDWTLDMTVIDHWNGRNYHSDSHDTAGRVSAPFPTVAAGDTAWQISYTIDSG